MPDRRGVSVLGATGSIGRTTLEVIESFPDRFRVVALTAHNNEELLLQQADRFDADLVVLAGDDGPSDRSDGRLARGWDALLEAAIHPDADIVVNGLVGAAGLEPTLRALTAAKRVALANKESLVVGGPLVERALEDGDGEIIPVDSEHSAVFQCLAGAGMDSVRKVVLTASGGPFRDRGIDDLEDVSPEDALRHPTWEMGSKVTIDSATLVNKALEVMEAHFLFGLAYDRIDVLIHPQSIVHSLVEFRDGSVIAQLGQPTMTVPVLYALSYPERLPFEPPRLDLAEVGTLTFEPVPPGRYRAFELGREAARAGGTAPAVFNAANEEAVAAFLAGELPFTGIPEVISAVLDDHRPTEVTSLQGIQRVDAEARERARARMKDATGKTERLT